MPGAPEHPQPRVRNVESTRVSHRRQTGITRHSRTRMVLTAYSALSPATNSSCHRRRRINGKALSPVGPALPFANLTPATGARTTRLCRPLQRRSSARRRSLTGNPPCHDITRPTLPRPPHPHPTFVTIAKRPSVWDGMAENMDLIWGMREGEYFCKEGWTENCERSLTGKSVGERSRHIGAGDIRPRARMRSGSSPHDRQCLGRDLRLVGAKARGRCAERVLRSRESARRAGERQL